MISQRNRTGYCSSSQFFTMSNQVWDICSCIFCVHFRNRWRLEHGLFFSSDSK